MELVVQRLGGADIGLALEALARLRIEVFREWPYLYQGTLEYEESYLQPLARSRRAVCVAAYADGQLVGASTGLPLLDSDPEFILPFEQAGLDPASLFYFGESVLLPAYRGRGLGRRFFLEREAHARDHQSFQVAAFCAVVRPPQHPLRPADYRSLEPFWQSLGYRPMEGVVASYRWRDLDQSQETDHPMQFWSRPLG